MDAFTESKLKEWGFQKFIERFKEEEIDSRAFLTLTEHMVAKLLPKIGQQSTFIHRLMQLNEKQEFSDNETFGYESISFYDHGAMSYDFECNSESERCKYDSEKDRKYTSKKIISKKEDSDIDGPFLMESIRRNRRTYGDDDYGNDNDNDGDYIPSDIALSKTIHTAIFATEKIVFETVAAPDVRVLSVMDAAADTDLTYRLDLLERYKAVNILNHSTFCKDQVLNNVSESSYFSKENQRIAEPTGMLNLYKAITKFESEHNYKFTFLASTIGKDLRDYTNNADLGLDPVHSVSNNVLDILHYPLRYGLIPTMSSFDLEMFLESIFLNNGFDSESTRQYKTGRSKKVRIDLIEGEIEALVFDYWSRSTVDLIKYDERIPRPELKDLLKYLYLRLCVPSTVVSKSDVDIFLTNFRKFAKFDLNDDIIPVSCLFFLKTKLSIVWSEISPSDQTLWSAFFNEMNVQHFLTAHTISAMFKTLDRHFEFIMSKAAQVRAFRGTSFPDVSLWCSNATSVPRECYYIVREEDVIRLLPTFFRSFTDIESLLCTAIDNFYYYHIFLLSRYAILHNINVATRVLTSSAVQGFLDDRTMDKYYQKSHVISHASERMQSMMVSCFRRLYIRDSDKFEVKFKITEFDPTLFQSLNELICDRMNSALYPVIDRKGQFSLDQFFSLHLATINVVDSSSFSSDHLCCYAFASSLYAHMYGLTIREHVVMQCDELNCNFKRDDKDYYDNIISETLEKNHLKK